MKFENVKPFFLVWCSDPTTPTPVVRRSTPAKAQAAAERLAAKYPDRKYYVVMGLGYVQTGGAQ